MPSASPKSAILNPEAGSHAGPSISQSARTRVILGAGCAGLSLAWHLIGAGCRDPIILIDRRDTFENDRTWCYWDVESTDFSDLATHSWTRWSIHGGGRQVVAETRRYPYLRLRSADVYRRILDRLRQAENVKLVLGTSIISVDGSAGDLRVQTSHGVFRGIQLFDSTGAACRPATREGTGLVQHFLGQTVRSARAVFDPSHATLMDFRVDQSRGPHFVYVLPYGEREALIENTYLFPFQMEASDHRLEVARYLGERYRLEQGEWELLEEERGAIPMRVGAAVSSRDPRVIPIGIVGGSARASSGYAFLRIQRHTRRLAQAVVAGASTTPATNSSPKADFFDSVFLRVLRSRPELAPVIFRRLFERAEADSVVRFLSERSTLGDDLRVIAALPKWPFLTNFKGRTWAESGGTPGVSGQVGADSPVVIPRQRSPVTQPLAVTSLSE